LSLTRRVLGPWPDASTSSSAHLSARAKSQRFFSSSDTLEARRHKTWIRMPRCWLRSSALGLQ
jgi:hypothetical protein